MPKPRRRRDPPQSRARRRRAAPGAPAAAASPAAAAPPPPAVSPAPAASTAPPAVTAAPVGEFAATIDDLAAALGIRPRMVQYNLRAGMPGRNADGVYNVAACRDWRSAHMAFSSSDPEEQTPRRRLDAAKAQREELRLARERSELLPADDVHRFLASHITECRAHLEELPPAIAASLPDDLADDVRRAAREAIEAHVRRALDSLADLARRAADEFAAADPDPFRAE